MNGIVYFWIAFVGLLLIVIYFDRKYSLLRDLSTADKKPYSFSRVQLAWWSVIVLASIISIVASQKGIPDLDWSTLVLLGISSATTVTANLIDVSDQQNPDITRTQDDGGQSFLLDILSDSKGVSIHRLQTVVFNLTIGIWFIGAVTNDLAHYAGNINLIIPRLTQNDLILLGLSSGTYAALKSTENKSNPVPQSSDAQPDTVSDEALGNDTGAEG
jgi:hypothetical protein